MPTGIPKSDSEQQGPSGYEFQEISGVEFWSSIELEHYTPANNFFQNECSVGQMNKATAVDQMPEFIVTNTPNYEVETLETLVMCGKDSDKKIQTKKKLEPDRRPFVSFSLF